MHNWQSTRVLDLRVKPKPLEMFEDFVFFMFLVFFSIFCIFHLFIHLIMYIFPFFAGSLFFHVFDVRMCMKSVHCSLCIDLE